MRLVEWRREQGLSQKEAAAAIGCDQSLVSLIERAVDPRVPSVDVMVKIYRATKGDVTPNDLVFPNGPPDLGTAELPLEPAPLFDGHGSDDGEAAGETQLQDIAA